MRMGSIAVALLVCIGLTWADVISLEATAELRTDSKGRLMLLVSKNGKEIDEAFFVTWREPLQPEASFAKSKVRVETNYDADQFIQSVAVVAKGERIFEASMTAVSMMQDGKQVPLGKGAPSAFTRVEGRVLWPDETKRAQAKTGPTFDEVGDLVPHLTLMGM